MQVYLKAFSIQGISLCADMRVGLDSADLLLDAHAKVLSTRESFLHHIGIYRPNPIDLPHHVSKSLISSQVSYRDQVRDFTLLCPLYSVH